MVTALAELKGRGAARLESVPLPTPEHEVAAFVDALLDLMAEAPSTPDCYSREEIESVRRMFAHRMAMLGSWDSPDPVDWPELLVRFLEEPVV